MPSRNSKDFITSTLPDSINKMQCYLRSAAAGSDHEPPPKRQRIEEPPSADKYTETQHASKYLQKRQVMAIGLKETVKLIDQFLTTQGHKLLVFVVHDKEHLESGQ